MKGTKRRGSPPTEVRVALIVERIRAIPSGFVRTYGDLEPSAPRMVGRVLATTRERLPWHRVVRADGSVAKGSRQLALLRKEGVPLIGDRVDLRRARVRAHIDKDGAQARAWGRTRKLYASTTSAS